MSHNCSTNERILCCLRRLIHHCCAGSQINCVSMVYCWFLSAQSLYKPECKRRTLPHEHPSWSERLPGMNPAIRPREVPPRALQARGRRARRRVRHKEPSSSLLLTLCKPACPCITQTINTSLFYRIQRAKGKLLEVKEFTWVCIKCLEIQRMALHMTKGDIIQS